jgi:hypothetical protein
MKKSTNTFVYSTLDSSNGEIRLIRLQPASEFAADIHCEIFHANLETEPYYEALSYAWGDPKITSIISVDGHEINVTVNLVSALRHLRLSDKARILWVDAICIDQQNITEREEQVALMGRIYRSAVRDLLWLGEDNGLDEHAATLLKRWSKRHLLAADVRPWNADEMCEWENMFANPETKERLINGLRKLLDHPTVWNRIWIIQEVVLAREVHVVYGFHIFSWVALQIFIEAKFDTWGIAQGLKELEELSFSGSRAFGVLRCRSNFRDGDTRSLIELWDSFGSYAATDIRDNVFAMLQLAKDDFGIRPDYSKQLINLYCEVTRLCILHMENLDILKLPQLYSKDELTNTSNFLPSWVPKFGVASRPSCLSLTTFVDFAAGIAYPSKLNLTKIKRDDDPRTLRLNRVLLGTVLPVSLSIDIHTWLLEDLVIGFREIKKEASVALIYSTEQQLFEAYWITLLLDQHSRSIGKLLRINSDPPFYRKLAPIFSNDRYSIDIEELDHAKKFLDILRPASRGTKFGVASSGHLMMTTLVAKEGDVICILYRDRAPMIICPVSIEGEEQKYRLVGPAYVHGFMGGEGISMQEKGLLEEREFNII